MATIFSHALVGCAVVSFFPKKFRTRTIYSAAGISAMLPDLDYLGFINRIPYDSLWGHRGLTHSILFAACIGLLAFLIARRSFGLRLAYGFLFFLTTMTHAAVDACTNGGLGVAFYSPYNLARYFFPWRPIQVSPMGMGVFSERGLVVFISEFFWIVIPCCILFLMLKALRSLKPLS